MANQTAFEIILKDTCQITGATWVACIDYHEKGWRFCGTHKLTEKRKNWLDDYLADVKVAQWVAGAHESGRPRSRKLASVPQSGMPYLYIFPLKTPSQIFIVGSEALSATNKAVWRLLAKTASPPAQSFSPDISDSFIFGGQMPAPYDITLSLSRVLTRILQYVPADGAWIATYGERSLRVEAEHHAKSFKNKEIKLSENKLLFDVAHTRTPLHIKKNDPRRSELAGMFSKEMQSCIILPLAIEQRLMGMIFLWREDVYSDAEWLQLQHLLPHATSAAEVFITFAGMADHLKRQAMLNDFALIISTAQNLSQIVQRVFALLSRTFSTKYISLFLLSSDRRTLREYRHLERRTAPRTDFLDGHPISAYIEIGQNIRINDEASKKYPLSNQKTKAALLIPLKYRGDVIGLLSLESKDIQAFNGYDENLLVVIASHLSGLVEYGRLRDEAEARARNLELIHDIIQHVIGLTNIKEVAQITADTLVQHFSYELAAVFLVDRNNALKINGISGEAASHIKTALESFESPEEIGITGYVYQTGKSVMVDDVVEHPSYLHIEGWDAGSEICVALQDGDRIWGVIDVESRDKNAFNHNDLLALESLAGFLTSAVSSVDRYQMLQDTIQILQTTQEELNERMEAQRNAENQLVQAAKLAAVGEMAAGVAHELNNPLTTVAGFSELVLQDLSHDAPQREDMELVLREASRARNVVRRLLDFARQSESVRVRADLNEVIEDVAILMRHLFETSQVRFSMNLMKNLPWAMMDRDQIKQVVLNLLHNALHAMPEGGDLSVRTVVGKKEERDWVVMSVKDSGKGISAHDLARIFEPFFTTKADDGGTGLGLAVSYGIITDHEGFIDVDSVPNEGASFNVWLPLEEEAA